MTHIAAPTDTLLGTRGSALAGLIGSLALVAAIGGIAQLDHHAAVEFAAGALAVCYAVYVGAALARGGPRELLTEIAFFAAGFGLVGLGLWYRPEYLALGWALHAVWDLLHHRTRHPVGTRGIPPWYVVACLVVDPVVAIGILVFL
ncbi:MAG: DUF6010 family protein [Carbonactinosporaceae bacterium]